MSRPTQERYKGILVVNFPAQYGEAERTIAGAFNYGTIEKAKLAIDTGEHAERQNRYTEAVMEVMRNE